MNVDNAKVSVIVPVYNVESYLKQCIDSLEKQTYTNIEVILVDDGSTDKSGEICDRYSKKYSNIKVYHKKNGGLVSAWQYGLNKSMANNICFVDPDDYVEKNYILSLKNAMDKYKTDVVFAPTYNYHAGKITVLGRLKSGLYKGEKYNNLIQYNLFNDGHFQDRLITPNRWGKLIKKSLILENLKYVDLGMTYGEDVSIIIPIVLSIKAFYVLPYKENGYMYRIRNGSMIQAYDKNRWNSVKLVYKNLYKALKDKHATDTMYKQLYIDYAIALILSYKNYIKSPTATVNGSYNLLLEMQNTCLYKNIKSVKNIKNTGYINNLILFNLKHKNYIVNKILFDFLRLGFKFKSK
ncbi:glycosyltransferase family 2 protein [Lactobacillus sp. LL6]|uniref:glycosyltransferase family 2 protein n=1 Tax=Lactobacillus sp. LL6 TaxID=2596827 RepID=UPI001186DA50|nr:glycosyltransferase family 2 protein [Lactobacillus sp. LL6]TSO25676.1 glycosyltransferase family 2 protein [Lactobacillus sp. LL6]